MPGINPIQGPTPSVPSPSAGGAKPNSSPRGADFSRMLRDYVTRVDGAQKTSASAITDLVSGKTEDIVSTVAAVALVLGFVCVDALAGIHRVPSLSPGARRHVDDETSPLTARFSGTLIGVKKRKPHS